MEAKEQLEAIESTISSRGWRLLREKFKHEKSHYQELAMETSPCTPEGVNNILHYQAMFNAVDKFYELVEDFRHELKPNKEGGEKDGL